MKNIFKYASLLLAAVMLLSCSGTIDPESTDEPNDGTNTETPGGNNQDANKPKVLKVSADKNIIQNFGGDYANITVTLGDEVLTEDILFFDGDNNMIELPDFKFASEETGKFQIWASYGTYISEKITITVIAVEVPATPEDPQPASTDFKARVLVNEFTTTGCMYCPKMKELLHGALDTLAVKGKEDMMVMTACHSSLVNSVKDPAYVRANGFEDFSGSTGMPYAFCDMFYGFGYFSSWTANDIVGVFEELYSLKEDKAAGIAVTSSLKDGELVIKATVKAARTGEYRLGAFLLEDGIYGKQSSATADWMHNHDNVIRYIDAKTYSASGKENYYGYSVDTVEAGKTADYVFVWDLDAIWDAGSLAGEMYGGTAWDPFVEENLHLVVFAVTTSTDENGDKYYYVNNVVDCKIGTDNPYEYK